MKTSPIIALLVTVLMNACGDLTVSFSRPTTSSEATAMPTATPRPLTPTSTSSPFPMATRPAPTAPPSATETPLPPTPASPPVLERSPAAPIAVGWQPLPPPECEALAGALAAQLAVSTTITISVFVYDLDTAGPNTGCQITAVATNQILQVEDGQALADKVETALAPLGWGLDLDSRYGAAAFSEVGADYYKGEGWCKLSIVGRATGAVVCSEGLSPTGCFYELPPAQQLYTIQLTCAQPVP
jgi:hypothetical protein